MCAAPRTWDVQIPCYLVILVCCTKDLRCTDSLLSGRMWEPRMIKASRPIINRQVTERVAETCHSIFWALHAEHYWSFHPVVEGNHCGPTHQYVAGRHAGWPTGPSYVAHCSLSMPEDRKLCNSNCDILKFFFHFLKKVVCLLSSNRKDKYDAIKKYLCTDCPTPSQCVLARTLSKPQTVMAIATKIALQMNCKMGGELWSVEIPVSSF